MTITTLPSIIWRYEILLATTRPSSKSRRVPCTTGRFFLRWVSALPSGLNLNLASVPPDRLVDAALRGGPYGDDTEWQLSIERLKAHPSGIDLGPLNPSCPGRLQTPDKRIRLAIPEVLKDIQRFREETDSDK